MIPYANQGPPFPAFRPPEIPLSFLYTEYPPCWEALALRVGNDWRWSVAVSLSVCVYASGKNEINRLSCTCWRAARQIPLILLLTKQPHGLLRREFPPSSRHADRRTFGTWTRLAGPNWCRIMVQPAVPLRSGSKLFFPSRNVYNGEPTAILRNLTFVTGAEVYHALPIIEQSGGERSCSLVAQLCRVLWAPFLFFFF